MRNSRRKVLKAGAALAAAGSFPYIATAQSGPINGDPQKIPGGNGGDDTRCTTWSSNHVGGAHGLMCDGSVRFVSENIDVGRRADPYGGNDRPGVLDGILTRSGGETVSNF